MEQGTGPPAASSNERELVREIGAPLFDAKGWMKFLGVLMIIYGVVLIFTIVGIILCWLPIWIGVLLLRTASSTEAAEASGSKQELVTALTKLRTYFTIYGVLAIIGLVAAVIALAVGGLAAVTSLFSNA
jgi:hypothetical protein